MGAPENSGTKVYTTLVEYSVATGQPTGRIKPNIPTDPDYIAPSTDLSTCPLPGDPVIPYIDIAVSIQSGFAATIELLFGTANISTDVTGTWHVVDRTYDGALFEIGTAPYDYKVTIVYNSGLIKTVNTSGVKNIYIPGPFVRITSITIASDEGDYDEDYSDDYLN